VSALHAILALAKVNDAQLQFLYIVPESDNNTGFYNDGIFAIEAMIDAIEKENSGRL